MTTTKYKFQRVFVIPAVHYDEIMRITLPYIRGAFVYDMVRYLAPRPSNPKVEDAAERFKASQDKLLKLWHEAIMQDTRHSLAYDGEGNYVLTVDITPHGHMRFLEPFKARWKSFEKTIVT